jgi:molybdopterin synthase catalytic subunit
MVVTVRFFATLKDRAGLSERQCELPEAATVAGLLGLLAREYPGLQPSLDTALVAINHEYAFPEDLMHDGDEIALFPPVSGGSNSGQDAPPQEYLAVTAGEIDLDAIVHAISSPETGGVCLFTGTVRGLTASSEHMRHTTHLLYEAYEPMAERKLKQVADEMRAQFPAVRGIALVQRIGDLQVGDVTVLVACSAGHRDEGIFEAARYGIDRLKEIVPVWKKEIGPDGSQWVEGHYIPSRDDVDGQS